MCQLCRSILSGRTSLPEARKKLPRLIDLETLPKKKIHYQQLYGNMEKAYERVFGKQKETYDVWVEESE